MRPIESTYSSQERSNQLPGRTLEPLQRLLLRASFLRGDEARRAWAEWRRATDLSGHVDGASFRLLPQLYRNVLETERSEQDQGVFKGIYRQTWYRNQLLLDSALPGLREMVESRLDVGLIEAPMFLVAKAQDLGIYLLDELQLLAPPEQFLPTIDLLRGLGWTPQYAFPERQLALGLSSLQVNEKGNRIRIHNMSPASWGHDPHLEYHDTQFRDVPLRVLDATGQLLLACTHQYPLNQSSHFLRVGVAALILSVAPDTINWDRLIRQATAAKRARTVRAVLGSIQDLLDAPIPDSIWSQLVAMPVSEVEEREEQVAERQLGMKTRLARLWYDHSRRQGDVSTGAKLRRFPAYLQVYWGLQYLMQVPGAAVVAWQRGQVSAAPPASTLDSPPSIGSET